MVAIHGYEAIKEALVTHGQQFSGRPPIMGNARFMASPIYPKMGMAEPDKWHGNAFRITGPMRV